MRYRPALFAAVAGLALAGPAPAQPYPACAPCGLPGAVLGVTGGAVALGGWGGPQPTAQVFQAAPPDRAALDRLNLRNEWTAYVPLEGAKDAIGTVQVIDDTQVLVQTRAGLLIAFDANSGAKLWTFHYPAGYSALYQVAVTDQFVFAVNVSRLFCIHRYTGVLEFNYELPGYATTGPAADRDTVYLTLSGTKVVAYRFPSLIRVEERPAGGPTQARTNEPRNPADALAARYTLGATKALLAEPEFDRPYERMALALGEPAAGLSTLQRTPSLSVLPTVTPPYTMAKRFLHPSPSLAVVPSLRQPYQFKPDYMRFNQRTPSISVLPPSVARAYELANLRPKGIEPTQEWSYGAAARLRFPPLRVTGLSESGAGPRTLLDRLWLTTDGPLGVAVSATTGRPQVLATFTATVAAPLAGPIPYVRPDRRPDEPDARTQLGFASLAEGSLIAVDLLGGDLNGPRVEWRANLGGLLDRKPLATADAVFAAGDHAGVSQVDVRTGEVIWRTEATADWVLAVNQEFVYVRDRTGNLLVYDRRRATDPLTRRAEPLARLNLSGFTVPVTNQQTDRVYLAADNGVLICLRDASAKYVRPYRVAPQPAQPIPAKKPEEKAPAAPPAAPEEAPPKKELPKKEGPKKDEGKKDEKTG